MSKVFGIDLGTTYSCIAYIDENGKPVVLKNAEGDLTTPSAVFFETQTDVTVGSAAKESAKMYPEQVVTFIKRSIGQSGFSLNLNGIDMKPEEISSYILKKVVKEAEIVVPAGTKLNIGRVEEQSDGRKTLTGNADQVLLPQNWNQDWVNKVRDIDWEVS